ncbi:hypothetical protein PVAND_015745 [Polypedilum vanderplanki]|uniref:Chitin-binding type-2 domain-containing protein n=1 Tax=Polypedilum vanderplanki TaxID=319348 RepID=A0A9J6BDS1_POLVA|nr:hypothetical protein PVAND_015745 [Polypedilum vanderplanki]
MKKFSFLIFTLTICAINGFNWNFFNIFHLEDKNAAINVDCSQYPNGQRFPDPLECSKFHRCINGDVIEFNCPFDRPNFHPCDLVCVTEEEYQVCAETCSTTPGPGPTNPPTDPGPTNPPTDPGPTNPPTDPGPTNPPTDPPTTAPGEIPTAGTQTTSFTPPTAPPSP